jgi:hypothetical protein
MIYSMALVSTSVIIVWKGSFRFASFDKLDEGPHYSPGSRMWWREVDRVATRESLQMLTTQLLFCNKTIYEEASMVFHNKNIFCFEGDHNWDPIVSWLKMIGPVNLNSLKSLQVDGKRPDQVWQNSKGERLRMGGSETKEEIYPRHPYLVTPGNTFKCGEVDNVNPAIEDVFNTLGQWSSEQGIILCMQLQDGVHPGAIGNPLYGGLDNPNDWCSMELSNLVGRFLDLHTYRAGHQDSVEVFWRGKQAREYFLADYESFERLGWVVTASSVAEDEPYNDTWDGSFPGPWLEYVIRRRKLVGPLLAQWPSS